MARPRNQNADPEPLQDSLVPAIADRGSVRQYPAHAVLVTEDDPSDALFITLSSRGKAYGADVDGREVIYNAQGAGNCLGEMTLDGGPRSASVMTLQPSICAVVPGAEVRDFLATHPNFALRVGALREIVSRIFKPRVEAGYVEMRTGPNAMLKKLPC